MDPSPGPVDPLWSSALRSRIDAAVGAEDWATAARAAWLLTLAAEGADRFYWFDAGGRVVWSAPLETNDELLDETAGWLRRAGRNDLAEAISPSVEAILARAWYPPLGDLTFRRLDGGDEFTTSDLLGQVVVLDFWASWCGPCRFELPRMQAFQEEHQDRGLQTLAINLQEQPELAMGAAAEFGLTLPVVEYGDGFADEFEIRKIPTIILVDRLGRIRGRWELFTSEVEERIYEEIDALLEPGSTAKFPIAQRLTRGATLAVGWMREFTTPVYALQVVAENGQTAQVVASVGRNLQLMQADAQTETVVPSVPSSGRLVPSKIDAEGGFSLLAYRLGGTTISRFELPQAIRTDWEAPWPLLDAHWVEPANPAAGAIVGTIRGLAHVDADGTFGPLKDVGLVRGVAPGPPDALGGATWVILTGNGEGRQWRRLASDLSEIEAQEIEGPYWRLEGVGARGYGVLSPSIKTAAVGRFFQGLEQEQVAVATGGELIVFETLGGKEIFRARWGGIETLAAADSDRDGADELYVSWGNRMAVLAESVGKE